MRAMFTAAVSLVICVGLFGCDQSPKAPVAAPVVAATPPCNCQQQAQAVAPAVAARVHRHRHHHAWHDYESSSSFESTNASTESASSYSSSNESHMYSEDVEQSQDSGGATQAQAAVWVDGYGRSHTVAEAATASDENSATLTVEERHNRRAVWRGYNSKCGNRGG